MSMIENINNGEAFDYSVNHGAGLHSNERIHGFVTVIKNKGKENEQLLCKNKHNLLTNAGRDYFHAQCYTNTSAGGIGVNYIALSENSSGANASHTAVANEITTGGLQRVQATTRSHTGGTNTTTLAQTFTSSATFTAVQLSGLLNASSTGTLGHESTFTSVALVSGDTLSVTWTLTLG
jgi:hypothetical protein